MRHQGVRAVLASEDRIYREGLLSLMARCDGVECAGATGSGSEAVAWAQAVEADVMLVDVTMVDSLALVRALARGHRPVPPVVLRVVEDNSYVLDLAEAGAAGYLTGSASLLDLCAAVESATRGELHCSPRIAAILHERAATAFEARPTAAPAYCLTPRECDVLKLMERGLSNKEIANSLQIEISTVKHHVHRILDKLHVHRRGEAAATIRRSGLLQPRGE
jgi:two-component system, NarL family, nitrate/nitrite response regulator NarL